MLSQDQELYLSEALNGVSRTFAIVIPCLEDELRHKISVAYLICRVLDNIEDCERDFEWKQERFKEVRGLILHPEENFEVLNNWAKEDWPGLTANEKKLMCNEWGFPLWEIYESLSTTSKEVISKWCIEMSKGMESMAAPDSLHFVEVDGVRCLISLEDLDQYCHFVAGTVGYMVSELACEHYHIDQKLRAQLLNLSPYFARGLQMTNILKDFAEDCQRGFSYIPHEWMKEYGVEAIKLQGANLEFSIKIITHIASELQMAAKFIMTLPEHARGFRLASLVCLTPAMATMQEAAKKVTTLFTENHHIKISREKLQECLMIHDQLLSSVHEMENYVSETLLNIEQVLSVHSPMGITIEDRSKF